MSRVALATLVGLALLAGCTSFPDVRPEPPRVSVVGVKPLNLSLEGQRLEFRLRVENPNPYDLPVRSLDFVARLAGEKLASGRSDEPVTIPANGEADVEIEVVAGIARLIGRVRRMLEEREIALDYDVSGTVRLDNWPRPIPFDVEGVVGNASAGEDGGGEDAR